MKIIKFILLPIIFYSIVGSIMAETYCRYEHEGETYYGIVEGDLVFPLDKAPWNGGRKNGQPVLLNKVKLLHPSEPIIILGLGGSYKNSWIDKKPLNTVRWFLKPPSSAASPGDDIGMPASLNEVKVETELVIVIGKTVKDAEPDEAADAIFGYTIGNDIVGNSDSYHRYEGEPLDTKENLLGPGLKIGDKFAPFGPFIYTDIEWKNREWRLQIEKAGTGEQIVHEDNTNNLVYSPEKIVSDLSKVLTLNPGDIIFSGTSKSIVVGDGDIVTVSIEGLGAMTSKIMAGKR